MSSVLVDSNVLLDVITDDPKWSVWSTEALRAAADRNRLVINPIIFAEVSVRFSRIEAVDDALPQALLEREAIPYEAAFLAAKVFSAYRRRGGLKLAPLPDIFIGAHAAVLGYRLMTRDAARYRTDFPTLALLTPS